MQEGTHHPSSFQLFEGKMTAPILPSKDVSTVAIPLVAFGEEPSGTRLLLAGHPT